VRRRCSRPIDLIYRNDTTYCQGAWNSAPGSGGEKCATCWGVRGRSALLGRAGRTASTGAERPFCAGSRLLGLGRWGVDVGGSGRACALAEAVALAFEGDHGGVVDESVDEGGGDHGVAEDLAPLLEAAV
jgi:hypothetical protein